MQEAVKGIAWLVEHGKIQFDGKSYTGIAADGVRVSFGDAGDELGTWAYLTTNPTPDQW